MSFSNGNGYNPGGADTFKIMVEPSVLDIEGQDYERDREAHRKAVQTRDRHEVGVTGQDEGSGFVAALLSLLSLIRIIITGPISIWFCIKMVQVRGPQDWSDFHGFDL